AVTSFDEDDVFVSEGLHGARGNEKVRAGRLRGKIDGCADEEAGAKVAVLVGNHDARARGARSAADLRLEKRDSPFVDLVRNGVDVDVDVGARLEIREIRLEDLERGPELGQVGDGEGGLVRDEEAAENGFALDDDSVDGRRELVGAGRGDDAVVVR